MILTLGLFTFAAEVLGLQAGPGLLGTAAGLPMPLVLGTWLLEAVGLTALFLILHGRTGSRFLDGLLVAWSAWLFRGPLLVITAVGVTRGPAEPWWSMALVQLAAYTLCGVVLAVLAGRTGLSPQA